MYTSAGFHPGGWGGGSTPHSGFVWGYPPPPRLIFTDTQISCTGFVKTLVKILKIPPECRKLIAKIPNFLRVQCAYRAHLRWSNMCTHIATRLQNPGSAPEVGHKARISASIPIFDNAFGAQCMMGRPPLPTCPIKSVLE